MMFRKLQFWLLVLLLVWAGWSVGEETAVAQTENELTLSLSRDFGTGLGNNVQGTFSFRVSGPDTLTRVTFYIDDQIVGEDSEAPFRLQFKTDNYPLGTHTLRAVGVTDSGQELNSNQIRRNFISSSSANRSTLYIIIPIIIIAIGGRLLSSWIANRGRTASGNATFNPNGPFGGTICPKCHKPFAMHIWGFNIGVGKYDRCPHCRKWSVVRRVHPDVLDASAEAMQQVDTSDQPPNPPGDDDENLRRRLDDSRFDS